MLLGIYMQIPKSTPKKLYQRMLENDVRPAKKPDIDNIIKSVADGLNNVAYIDDSQIIKITAEKFYSENPRIEVTVIARSDEIGQTSK